MIKRSFIKIFKKYKNFTQSNKQNRYEYNYESPEEQNIKIFSSFEKLLKLIIKLSAFYYFIKWTFFTKFNQITKQYKIYLINDKIEYNFSSYLSKRLQMLLENYIYKTDSSEVGIVYKIFTDLLVKNKIHFTNEITLNNIFVIDSPSIGAFLFKNGDLYISNRVLELSNNDENEIAFFISCEIAHLIMDKSTERLKFYIHSKIFSDETVKVQSNDFIAFKRDKLLFLNKFLLFYPESNYTFFEEIEICRIALKVLKNAGYDLDKSINIMKKFDIRLKNYHRIYKENMANPSSLNEFRYYDKLKQIVLVHYI